MLLSVLPVESAELWMASATIIDEIVDKAPRAVHVDGVKNMALMAPGSQQPSPLKLRQVRRQGGGRNVELAGYIAGRQPLWRDFHEPLEDTQPMVLSNGREGGDRCGNIHI